MKYFVTGIDTDSGKTLVSAILCEALQADYWKPVQAGLPRDTDTVQSLVTNNVTKFHAEAYLLNTPASPHMSARIDGVKIDKTKFVIPATSRPLIIEGAGGCLVPLNESFFVIDLIKEFNVRVMLVADLYLGSINHTLLSVEALRSRNIQIAGIIFNGISNPDSEQVILQHTKLPCLLHIDRQPTIDKSVVVRYADLIRKNLR
ncbi:MAG TPA: dethiobiotin synthase [Chryseosolibacter sp.]|nr:dethiobiotin synthase [Chryseosolibacter sp.]